MWPKPLSALCSEETDWACFMRANGIVCARQPTLAWRLLFMKTIPLALITQSPRKVHYTPGHIAVPRPLQGGAAAWRSHYPAKAFWACSQTQDAVPRASQGGDHLVSPREWELLRRIE
ncbi:hypothetical protein SUGI_1189090 [Cryptomeria japonica]|nr:hypothetical protein SUGI_1189090 [Cryptomeria japonica]